MHIGVDASCWSNNRGYGRHARSLLGALVRLDRRNRYTFVVDSPCGTRWSIPIEAEVRQVATAMPTVTAASSAGRRSFGDMWKMSRALSDARFDIVLFPTVYSFVPVFGRAKKVVMFHDLIAEVYPRLTLPSARARIFWTLKVELGRRQADAIATVSEFSRRMLAEHFRIAIDDIYVVGEASDPVFRVVETPQIPPCLAKLGLESKDRAIVYVGGFSPHKNLTSLVSVFARLANEPEFSDVRLVMVGENKNEAFHSYFANVKTRVEALGIEDRVVFAGYLHDEELAGLLSRSTMLVLPSLLEGFGLPAVEAAACGCPVIATTASPLPELLGEGGIYINPRDPEALLSAITQVLRSTDLRSQMRKVGLMAASQLSWEAAGRQMMDLLTEVGER